MTMTIRDVKALAEDKWAHYFCWKMYPEWTHLLWTGACLWLISFTLAVVSAFLVSNTDIYATKIIQVNVTEPGMYTVSRYSDGSMVVNQNNVSGEQKELPYLDKTATDSIPFNYYHLIKIPTMLCFLGGAFLLLLYIAKYIDKRAEYVTQQTQLWVDSNRQKLPTEESVAEFVKLVREGKR